MGMCLKGLIWPPLEPKSESCFSPISSDWFNRIINSSMIFWYLFKFNGYYMLTKMADKLGLK